MDHSEALRRLDVLPAQIEGQETVFDGAVASLRDAKDELEAREDYFTSATNEDGSPKYLNASNAERRSAQLRSLTSHERKLVRDCEKQKDSAERVLNRLRNDFSAAKYSARLLSGDNRS